MEVNELFTAVKDALDVTIPFLNLVNVLGAIIPAVNVVPIASMPAYGR